MMTKNDNHKSGLQLQHIKTQKGIAVERARLKLLIQQDKAALSESITTLRDEFNPITKIAGTVKNVASSDKDNPLVGLGMSFISDKLVKNVILKKSGWITKLIIPVLVKKISTYAVANLKNEKIAAALHKAAEGLRK